MSWVFLSLQSKGRSPGKAGNGYNLLLLLLSLPSRLCKRLSCHRDSLALPPPKAAPWDLWIPLEWIPLSGGFLVSGNKQDAFKATQQPRVLYVKGLGSEDFILSFFPPFSHFLLFSFTCLWLPEHTREAAFKTPVCI